MVELNISMITLGLAILSALVGVTMYAAGKPSKAEMRQAIQDEVARVVAGQLTKGDVREMIEDHFAPIVAIVERIERAMTEIQRDIKSLFNEKDSRRPGDDRNGAVR